VSNSLAFRTSRTRRFNGGTWLIFALPAFVLFAVFVLYPIGSSIWLSFFQYSGVGPETFLGFGNYTQFLASADFLPTLVRSLFICFSVTAGSTVLGILVAGGVHIAIPGARIFRVACFIPFIIPLAISGTFWNTAFQPTGGLVNTVLGLIGLGDNHLWIGSPQTAIYPIIFVAIWIDAGFSMLLILAAMENIPPEIDEAALIDGAGPMAMFFQITMPLVRRVVLLTILLQMIFSFRLFTVVYTLTQGGPGNSTQVFPTLVYRQAFEFKQFGGASAIAVISTVLVLVLVGAFIAIFRPFRSELES
jgi:ABC-type sugar transport system permease subunit